MFSLSKLTVPKLHSARTSISGCSKFLSFSHPAKICYTSLSRDVLRWPIPAQYSCSDSSGNKPLFSAISEKDGSFSGEIPIDKLQFKHSRSSGPGGQNVNKVATKVELRFKMAEADWIPDIARQRLIEQQRNRITKEGEFYLTSEKTRKQILNQADCVNRLRQMIFDAAKEPKQPTVEEIALAEKRAKRRASSILREKRHHSLKKQTRGSLGLDS